MIFQNRYGSLLIKRYYTYKWYEDLKLFLNEKIKHQNYTVVTPFLSQIVTPLEIAIPTFAEVDSFSEFETEMLRNSNNNNWVIQVVTRFTCVKVWLRHVLDGCSNFISLE